MMVIDKIRNIMSTVPFNITEFIAKETKIKLLNGWDSLKHLTFMIVIEKKFQIEITPEEMADVETINDLLSLIEGKQ